MDIKTVFYLANFENNYEDFKQRLDEIFGVEDKETKYDLTVSSLTFTPRGSVVPPEVYWDQISIEEIKPKKPTQ